MNFWNVAIGRLRKLRRSSNFGIPLLGSFCAQLAAGTNSKPVKHGNRIGKKPKQDETQDNFLSCRSVRLVPTVGE